MCGANMDFYPLYRFLFLYFYFTFPTSKHELIIYLVGSAVSSSLQHAIDINKLIYPLGLFQALQTSLDEKPTKFFPLL